MGRMQSRVTQFEMWQSVELQEWKEKNQRQNKLGNRLGKVLSGSTEADIASRKKTNNCISHLFDNLWLCSQTLASSRSFDSPHQKYFYSFLTKGSSCSTVNSEQNCHLVLKLFLPPVTSHMGVMGESSDGTPPRGSGSTEALPGIRNTRANRRWSQRKGSLVSSLPGSGVVRGRWSWRREKKRALKKGRIYARNHHQANAENISEGIQLKRKCCYHISYAPSSHTNSLLSIILLYKCGLWAPMNIWHPQSL